MYQIVIITVLFCCLAGCANVLQKDVPTARPRGVLEEDITDGGKPRSEADQGRPSPSNVTGSQPTPSEGLVPLTETGAKSPRRIIWRDRKGSDKKREPSADSPIR